MDRLRADLRAVEALLACLAREMSDSHLRVMTLLAGATEVPSLDEPREAPLTKIIEAQEQSVAATEAETVPSVEITQSSSPVSATVGDATSAAEAIRAIAELAACSNTGTTATADDDALSHSTIAAAAAVDGTSTATSMEPILAETVGAVALAAPSGSIAELMRRVRLPEDFSDTLALPPRLVPVTITPEPDEKPAPAASETIEIEVGGDCHVRVGSSFDGRALKRVLDVSRKR